MVSQDTENVYHVEEEGTDDQTFSCKTCDYKYKKEGTVKSHVTRQHIMKHKKENLRWGWLWSWSDGGQHGRRHEADAKGKDDPEEGKQVEPS